MGVEALLWDFGGVIVQDNVKPAFSGLKIPYADQARAAWKECRLGYITIDEFFHKALADTPYEPDIPMLRHNANILLLQPEGALPLVQRFSVRYKQGAISNHSREWGKYIVDKWELRQYLNPIVISAEVGMDKSTDKIFRHALDTLRLSADKVLFIDNEEKNVEMAKSIGMHGLVFTNASACAEALRKHGVE